MFFVQNKWQGFYFADLHDSNASVDTTQKALISISQILCFVDIDIIHIVNASGISLRFRDQKLDGGNLMRLLEPLLVLALGTDIVFTRWGSVHKVGQCHTSNYDVLLGIPGEIDDTVLRVWLWLQTEITTLVLVASFSGSPPWLHRSKLTTLVLTLPKMALP